MPVLPAPPKPFPPTDRRPAETTAATASIRPVYATTHENVPPFFRTAGRTLLYEKKRRQFPFGLSVSRIPTAEATEQIGRAHV